MKLVKLAKYLDKVLNIHGIDDVSLNGLQVGGDWEVTKVALAVDACMQTFQRAANWDAGLLLVHHGLFWEKPFPLRGIDYEKIAFLVQSNLGVYAAHLPLDVHPGLGNNARIFEVLDLRSGGEFGTCGGRRIGLWGFCKETLSLREIKARLLQATGERCRTLRFGPEAIQRVAILSGKANLSVYREAWEGKFDLLVTGETSHSAYTFAEDHGMNVLYAGHYGSESLGIKALGMHLTSKFGLETKYLDHPTGM
jgi:dinuclear metal center YbgI/SA1388 family protein